MKWKTHTSRQPSGKPMTQEQVNRALMYLCAQPEVAKQIRKLWASAADALENRQRNRGDGERHE